MPVTTQVIRNGAFDFLAKHACVLRRSFDWTDEDGDARDLSGYTAALLVKTDPYEVVNVLSFDESDGVELGGETGTVAFEIPGETMATLDVREYWYDLTLVEPGGEPVAFLAGTMRVTVDMVLDPDSRIVVRGVGVQGPGGDELGPDLTAIEDLTPSDNDLLQRKAGAWTNRTPAQVKTDLVLVKADVGLGNADNVSDANKPVSTATQTALDGKQPFDSDLTAIAALSTTSYGRALLALADAAAGRTAFGLGTAATMASGAFDTAGAAAAAQAASQPLDSDLTAIAALTTTSYGRALLGLADAAAGRTALGLGTAAVENTGAFDAAGSAAAAQAASQPLDSDLTSIAALSTTSYGRAFLALADAAAGRTALGLGTAAVEAATAFDAAGAAAAAQAASQPLDGDLTAIAALTTTSYGRALLALADAAAGRTALGLGTAATQASTAFEVAGAAAAAQAASQPLDSDLTAIAALTTTSFGRGLLALGDAAAGRTTLGLVIGTNVQAWDADLDSWAGKTAPSGTAVGTTDTQTLTNKRLTPRVTTITSSATPTVNTDDCDDVTITALATNITSMTTSLTGTPANFDKLIIRILDNGVSRTITWGAKFIPRGIVLPTATVAGKVTTVGFIYDTVAAAWAGVALAREA